MENGKKMYVTAEEAACKGTKMELKCERALAGFCQGFLGKKRRV